MTTTRPDALNAPTDARGNHRILQQRSDRLVVELPNRMIVVAQELPTAPVVSAQVWVKTGSIYEQEHVGAGLSHFLEHLLSGGSTRNRTEAQSNETLGRIGARTNAATSLDTVRYYINTTRDYTGDAIDLLSDWMRHSLITQAEYEREREVIQREFEMGSGDPGRIFWKLTQQTRYQAHPARHPTIGYLDEFLSITRDEIYDFYRRMYVPNNMVFVVVGDIDKQRVVAQVAALWHDAEPGELPSLRFPVEPDIEPGRVAVAYADVARPRLRLTWPGVTLGSEHDYALDVLGMVLGQGETSRLVRTVRDQQRLVTSVVAYNYSVHWGEGFFGVDSELVLPPADPDHDDPAGRQAQIDAAIETTEAAILQQIQHMAEEGILETELARARRQVLAQVIMSNQSAENIAQRLARDLVSTGDPDYLRRYADAIQSITAEQVRDAARRYLARDRMIRVTLLPRGEENGVTEFERPPQDVADDGLAWEPVDLDNRLLLERLRELAGDAEAESEAIRVDPVQMFRLDNGLRVLVGRSNVVPAVALQWYQLGGLLADEPGREGVANAAAAMLTRGTTTRTADQISDAVESLGASLNTQSGNNTVYATAACLREDWPTMMQLLADITFNPTFPEQEWSKLQPRLLAAIDRQNDRWNGELRTYFREAWFGEHPWSQSPTGRREVVETLTPDDLKQFHFDRLGAEHTVLAVFGDVQVDEVRRQAQQWFGAMPAQPRVAFEARLPEPPQGTLVQRGTNKPLAAVQVGFGPGIDRAHADYATMQVLSRVLSDFPAGWLEQELRGRGPGLVYAVGAANVTGVIPGYFVMLFNTEPASVPAALQRAMNVIDRARTETVSEQDLARARAKLLTDEFFARQSNADRAAAAALDTLYGLGLDESERYLAAVQSISPEDLRQAARRYLARSLAVVMSHQPIDEAPLQQALTPAAAPAGE